MDQSLIDIGIRRGRLLERIANQRKALVSDLQPVCRIVHAADHAVVRVRLFSDFLKRHPALVLASVALLVALKPYRAWRWAKRGFMLWRTWQSLRTRFAKLRRRPA